MKIFLKKILLFIIFTAAVYILLLMTWGKFMPQIFRPNLTYPLGSVGHMHTRISELNSVTEPDILFLGSSHAYRGFDTRIFGSYGYKTFNLGSSSQTPVQTKILLQRYLGRIKPAMIVYDICPADLASDGVESAIDIIANDKIDMLILKMAFEINNIKVYNSLLYGFINKALGLENGFREAEVKDGDRYIPGGFVEKDFGYYRIKSFSISESDFSDDQIKAFADIISLIRKQNIPLILVNAPVTGSYYNSFANNSSFDSLAATYGKYYNFNGILQLNDSLDFYDEQHLNMNGVLKYNEELIRVIFR